MNQPSRLRIFLWKHPEWWSLVLSLLAWLTLLAPTGGAEAVMLAHHHGAARFPAAWGTELFWWMVMVIAMMWPLITDRLRATATRSLWPRRHWAITVFLLGYLAVWLVAGAAVVGLIWGLRKNGLGVLPTLLAMFALAALWQLTPFKEQALRLCHRTMPLAPESWRADRDCLRYGWMIGGSCLLSCGMLMAACALSSHALPAMVGSGFVGFAERYALRPNQRMLSGLIAGVAVVCMLFPVR